MSSTAEHQAAELAGILWASVIIAGGPTPENQQHRYFPGLIEPALIDSLPLPVESERPGEQPVAFLDGDRSIFEQQVDEAAIQASYSMYPRSRVYPDIGFNEAARDTWYKLLARHLGRLAHSKIAVMGYLYESRPGEKGLGAHRDLWYGINIQLRGAKLWRIGRALLEPLGDPVSEVLTEKGGVLLVPSRLPHEVSTPEDPGYSLHLSLSVNIERE